VFGAVGEVVVKGNFASESVDAVGTCECFCGVTTDVGTKGGHVLDPGVMGVWAIGQEEKVNVPGAGLVLRQVHGNNGVPFLGFVNVDINGNGGVVGLECPYLIQGSW